MKYATAMLPARMNATGRVNNPRMISTPPTISRQPCTPNSDNSAGASPARVGNESNFCVP